MIVKSSIKIGSVAYQFEIDEKDEMATLHKIIVLSNPHRYCHECKNTDPEKFALTSNKDKEGNTYINVKCVCGARSKLGQYKTGGYFWHDFEKYVPQQGTKSSETRVTTEDVDTDDIPF